jgi:hypothetical protein
VSTSHKLIALALAVFVVPTSLWALTGKNKKKKADPPAPVIELWPRDGIPGFAVVSMENGNGDTFRVEAQTRAATIPNIMANDVDFVEVVGSQTEVTLYEQPNFRGHSLTLRCGNYELLQQPRNDIESIAVRYVRDDRRCQGTPERPIQYRTWTR